MVVPTAAEIATLAGWLRSDGCAVAFTGAGISTESGIPDYRSPGGVWAKYRPVEYGDFMTSAAARREYWRQKCEGHGAISRARPNGAHAALARWEAAGIILAVVTQNIDGLHQTAGSRLVHELHGTARQIACQDCGGRFDAEAMVAEFERSGEVPACPACPGGRLKHATVSFGQALPVATLEAAIELAQQARTFLVVGSSLAVEPAASLPRLARAAGARLVIVNRDPTPQDGAADLILRTPIAATLEAVDAAIGEAVGTEA